MRFERSATILTIAVCALPLTFTWSSCAKETAELDVDLPAAAKASPQYFHGNCLAGWSVAVELRLRETRGVEVVLDVLTYRVVDAGTMEELAAETLDRTSLEARYGSPAVVLPGRSSRSFVLGFPTSARPVGPLGVSGSVSGRDENGRAVSAPFDLATSVTVENDGPPPAGGACP